MKILKIHDGFRRFDKVVEMWVTTNLQKQLDLEIFNELEEIAESF